MGKHKFLVGMFENGVVVGARCTECGVMALYENGKVPDDIRSQECSRPDSSQNALRVVREATEDK
ncbi:MAG TPA: hypothetical protein VN946_01860 [Terriglobales bacterium]|nr:hypothetical protein [Terriglobales bacterium]